MQQTIDLTQLSIEELKSLAYDQKVAIEMTQQNLTIIEGEIQRKIGDLQKAQADEQRQEALKREAEAAEKSKADEAKKTAGK